MKFFLILLTILSALTIIGGPIVFGSASLIIIIPALIIVFIFLPWYLYTTREKRKASKMGKVDRILFELEDALKKVNAFLEKKNND